ncbi:MAG TPA: ABC transporter ATP-binding protein [Acidimicrobiales bacterium]|nr:ABC transporter ATP-binding protein [Acidimicrobiales bacterium]
MADPAAPIKLQMRNVHKSYRADQAFLPVLDGIDLVAHEGEFVSVIGPSGCGKSTLLEVVAGLQSPDEGDVLVDGIPSAGAKSAYMPQKDLLFPWRRVIDNVTLGLEVAGVRRAEARQKVAPLLEAFGLAGFESSYPFQLSGGMRQRAALLRTVVQERSLLLLDEPLGALDSLTRTEMQVWLESVWGRYRWTVLLVTHDIREAVYLSDTVYVLSGRPARVIAQVDVGLPRPRSVGMIASPATAELEGRLLASLQEGKLHR